MTAASLPLVKIILVFALMLTGIRFKLGIGLSILSGSLALALFFGHGPLFWLKGALTSLTEPDMLYLTAIVTLILILSDLLEKTGQTERLMQNISGYLRSPALRLTFFPALIGLLPMPGGAGFSAPLVGTAAEPLQLPAMDRALINYWFRHVWELSWPLYPGVILASGLSQIPLDRIILVNLPCFFLVSFLGWFAFLRPGLANGKNLPAEAFSEGQNGRDPKAALVSGLPLLIAIAGSVASEAAMGDILPGGHMEAGIVAALILANACSAVQNRIRLALAREILTEKALYQMVFVVASIFVFKDILISSGAVEALARMGGGKTALFLAACFAPFVVGMMSGITIAFVGSTFPLIMGLIQEMGLESQRPAYVMLAFFCGYSGIMASPLHICFIFSCQYFKTDMAATWRAAVWPGLAIGLAGILYFFLLTI